MFAHTFQVVRSHGHYMNFKAALDELASFDDAVAKAVSMTDPKDTLIVVTADHSHFTIERLPKQGESHFGVTGYYDYVFKWTINELLTYRGFHRKLLDHPHDLKEESFKRNV